MCALNVDFAVLNLNLLNIKLVLQIGVFEQCSHRFCYFCFNIYKKLLACNVKDEANLFFWF